MKLSYTEVRGDLFATANQFDILLHACNGCGIWGAGIAAAFAKRNPEAAKSFAVFCATHRSPHELRGKTPIFQGDGYLIACPITSLSYGARKDPPGMILESTRKALLNMDSELTKALPNHEVIRIASPMINAGLFSVPWNDTRAVIEEHLKLSPLKIQWTTFIL